MDDLNVEPVVDVPQVDLKIKKKRVVGTLGRIKVLLEGKELSFDEIYQALGKCSSVNSVQSTLSQSVKKGLLQRTDFGYKLREVEKPIEQIGEVKEHD